MADSGCGQKANCGVLRIRKDEPHRVAARLIFV
jgi:hypothetical protein